MFKKIFQLSQNEESRPIDRKKQKELQRRIFLNTMRTVYPNSFQIKYVFSEDEGRFLLHPLSVSEKCKSISDKVWNDHISKLNNIFISHVAKRERMMISIWGLILLFLSVYIVVGVTEGVTTELWFTIVGPILILLSIVLAPNLCFTYLAMKPMLKEFEQWKRDIVLQFDKRGVEIVKITTGELISDKSPYRIIGSLYYGSLLWFRYEDAQVEIFWRSVKAGKHVRRYSLMITTGSPMECEGSDNKEQNTRQDPKLAPIDGDDGEDVDDSRSTLG